MSSKKAISVKPSSSKSSTLISFVLRPITISGYGGSFFKVGFSGRVQPTVLELQKNKHKFDRNWVLRYNIDKYSNISVICQLVAF